MSDFLSATVNSDRTVNTVATPDNTSASTKGTSTLGKDAFLNLLVAQMKYQDPLNPTSDTEWIAQMATFSSLEEMQNMNQTISNSQALSLVGKTVIINSDSTLTGGKVDYVVMQNGKAYLAVNNALYSIDDLDTVADEEYLDKLKDKDKVDSAAESEEEEESDTEKLLEAIEKLVGKMDTVGTAIDNAAESINDAVESINNAAENIENAGNSSNTETDKEEEKVLEKIGTSTEMDVSEELTEAAGGAAETDSTDAAETENSLVSEETTISDDETQTAE